DMIENIGKRVYLEDIKEGAAVDLSTTREYSFSYEEGEESEGRFFLRIGGEGDVVNNTNTSTSTLDFTCWSFGNEVIISYNGKSSGKLEIYDALGRKVYEELGIGIGLHRITPRVSYGTYMLRFTNETGVKVMKLYIEE
ncbi:MAG TPA: T9SS type A sorting domain-containing protein, partial [Bacteroidales bacterium]|nr:T9SS type A sorting domain-containing protein [Bacteroidales bacterium]